MSKEAELTLRIVLEKPTPGVDYGLQEGTALILKPSKQKEGMAKT